MNIFKLLFSFKGRITRAQYWLAGSAQAIAFVTLIVVVMESLDLAPDALRAGRAAGDPEVLSRVGAAGLYLLLGFAVLAWSGAAVYTKRLHDRNKGAIWLLAVYIPPFLPLLSLLILPKAVVVAYLITLIFSLWTFIELGCLAGTQGPNRFDVGSSSAYLDDAFGERPAPAPATARQSLGGMEAAMAAVTAAARAAPLPPQQSAYRAAAASPQFGGGTAQGFGRKNVPQTSGGFGRRGL